MKNATKTLVLLDAHAIIHRAYHALPPFSSPKGEPTGAIYGLVAMLLKIIKDLKPDYIAAAYDLPGKTFRDERYAEYKAHRPKLDPELSTQIDRSRGIFKVFDIPIYEKEGFEADDIIGTIAEQVKDKRLKIKDAIKTVIASGDMDTMQLVDNDRVLVYTLKKGINDTILYDERAVKERFALPPALLADYKGLRGDPSDNIIGVPGIGEKTATELVGKFGGIDDIYKKLKKNRKTFLEAGVKERIVKLLEEHEEEALFSKMLATIRRDVPIDFDLEKCAWPDGFSKDAADALFAEFGFRTLRERLKTLEGGAKEAKTSDASLDTGGRDADFSTNYELRTTNSPEFTEAAIALWLLDSNISSPTLEDILSYADTKDFSEARKKILTEVKKQGLEKVLNEIELPLVPVLQAAEERGILVDKMYFTKISRDYHKKLSVLESKIYEYAGMVFNINSPKQLSDVLFNQLHLAVKGARKTAGGALSTRAGVLEKLRDAHPIIEELLAYRELSKLLTTYLDAIPPLLDSNNRLHTHFVQTGSATGRLSSQNPNLQNIPIRSEQGKAIRNGFLASPGHVFLSFDYSQIELRVAAIMSGDKKLKQIFREGGDVHASVAAEVFGVPARDVDYEMRRRAKIINFGIIYGMGVNALKQSLGTTLEEAKQFYERYFDTFSELAVYLEKIKSEAKKKGYTETLFGRRRHFPALRSPLPYIRAEAERAAMNAPLQGTAADIIKMAMIKVDRKLREKNLIEKTHLLLQIHDDLIYEVEGDIAKEAAKLIEKEMETIIESSVPLAVHVSVGQNWGEMK